MSFRQIPWSAGEFLKIESPGKAMKPQHACIDKMHPKETSLQMKKFQDSRNGNVIIFWYGFPAAYKVPKVIEFRTELPKSLIGKVLRRELRDHA